MELENKLKWARNGCIAVAIFGTILTFNYSEKLKNAARTETYQSHENTKNIIENIERNKPSLTKNAYFAEDTLLKESSQYQLESDSLAKKRFENHLSRIEKDPEFIKQEEIYSKNNNRMYPSLFGTVLAIVGALSCGVAYKFSKNSPLNSPSKPP